MWCFKDNMSWKKPVKITVCVLLLLLFHFILDRYSISWNIFTQLSKMKNVHFINDNSQMSKNDPGNKNYSNKNKDIKSESLQVPGQVSAVSKSMSTVDVVMKTSATLAHATSISDSNTLLVQEVTALLKAQLELKNTMTPFSEKTPCVPKSRSVSACLHQNCTQLSNNMTERVQSLFSEKTVLTKEQDDLLRSIASQIPEKDVILLTAASSNHYDEMQALLHSLHSKVFPELSKRENVSLVLWDIGLTSEQRHKTEKCCRCQVISFPFEKFPKSVGDLHCYMWKPLAIRMTQYRARKYVVWQDVSIRYNSFPGPLFENAMRHGLQLIRESGSASTVFRTLPETFAYLGQNVCSFYVYEELGASFGVYKHDPFVMAAVTSPWARCGLEEKCMCPRPTTLSLICAYGPCHRFDQSALTIITATLYSSEMYKIFHYTGDIKQYLSLRRGNKEVNYFNTMGCLL